MWRAPVAPDARIDGLRARTGHAESAARRRVAPELPRPIPKRVCTSQSGCKAVQCAGSGARGAASGEGAGAAGARPTGRERTVEADAEMGPEMHVLVRLRTLSLIHI